jgi:RES domain-containing protein
VNPRRFTLPEGRAWLRLADPEWSDPLDPSFAQRVGSRWNPPGSFPTLFLNGDVVTARLQIERLLQGSPVRVEDLDDEAFVLVAATLPRKQDVADVVTPEGIEALGLPPTYPRDASGAEVPHQTCQASGANIRALGFRGVWCRSASTKDGRGRELAWFPATGRSRANALWDVPRPFGAWRDATEWTDLGLGHQPEPNC